MGLDHLLVTLDSADYEEDLVESREGDLGDCLERGSRGYVGECYTLRWGDVAVEGEVVDLGGGRRRGATSEMGGGVKRRDERKTTERYCSSG